MKCTSLNAVSTSEHTAEGIAQEYENKLRQLEDEIQLARDRVQEANVELEQLVIPR